jgi:spore coat polysaccharide biosynthesis protein SpsF (cytidylyltransferase family)
MFFSTATRPTNRLIGRFLGTVDGYSGAYLLRITCDNYLIQPDVVEGLIAAADYDHVAPLSHFSGEVVRIDALRANRHAWPSPRAREHVTFGVRADPSLAKVVLPADCLGLDHERKLTLDTLDDMLTMKKLELTHPDLKPLRCLTAVRAVCGRS